MADSKPRYWLIWVDDTPINVDTPLAADTVADAFEREVADDPTTLIEVKMCTREDLDWAGTPYSDGMGADELPDEDDEQAGD